jgi:hypothetical protein
MQPIEASPFARYALSARQPVPFAGYASLLVTYGGLLATTIGLQSRSRWGGLRWGDLFLTGIATHELTIIVTRDFVTCVVRAPFAIRERNDGAGEVIDKAEGTGFRRALGELLTCQYCTAPWVATVLSALWASKPRAARLVCGIFAVAFVSDVLHHAYALLKIETSRARKAA